VAWRKDHRTAGAVGLAPTAVAGRAADPARAIWEWLGRPAAGRGEFDPAMTIGLPKPARRWLTHGIRPGMPLARAVVLDVHGQIRIRRWLPFRAVQLQAPPDGYVWAARAALGPLHISGFDRYAGSSGQMRWRLAGRVPVLSAAGPNIDRSAAGRVALDAVFVPTAFLSDQVTWRPGPDPDSAVAEWTVGDQVLPVELRGRAGRGAALGEHAALGQPGRPALGALPVRRHARRREGLRRDHAPDPAARRVLLRHR